MRSARITSGLALAVTVALGAPAGVEAQAGRARVEEGNRLYRDGRFEEADQKYLEAMAEAPGHSVQRRQRAVSERRLRARDGGVPARDRVR